MAKPISLRIMKLTDTWCNVAASYHSHRQPTLYREKHPAYMAWREAWWDQIQSAHAILEQERSRAA